MNDDVPEIVKRLLKATALYSFPAIGNRILECIGQNDQDPLQLAQIIQTDPALSVAILKRINSPSYGLVKQITGVDAAVIHLGMKESLNIAFSQVMMTRVASLKASEASDFMVDVWRRSMLTGVICEFMNRHLDLGQACYYTCGLLSKIGCLALFETYRERYRDLYLDAHGDARSLKTSEIQYLSTTNERCRDWLIDQWNIPKPINDPFTATGANNPARTSLIIASGVCDEICKFSAGDIPSNSLGDFTQKYLSDDRYSATEKADESFYSWLKDIKTKFNKK